MPTVWFQTLRHHDLLHYTIRTSGKNHWPEAIRYSSLGL
jgi:hypothetical protein